MVVFVDLLDRCIAAWVRVCLQEHMLLAGGHTTEDLFLTKAANCL